MTEKLEKLVLSTKAELNAVSLAAACLDWAWKAALAGLAVFLPLRFFGLGWEGVALWVALVCAASGGGYLSGLPRRLSSASAARWLDERMESRELLSSALVCLARESESRFDAELLGSAEALASSSPKPRVPLKPLLRRAAWVCALCLACLSVLILAGPAAGGMRGARSPGTLREGGRAAGLLNDVAKMPEQFKGQEAKDLAYQLFPRDKRMASLAEKALSDGRVEDLRELLDRAEREFDKALGKAKSELARQEIAEEQADFDALVNRRLGSGQKPGGGASQKNAPGQGQRGDPGRNGAGAAQRNSPGQGPEDSEGGNGRPQAGSADQDGQAQDGQAQDGVGGERATDSSDSPQGDSADSPGAAKKQGGLGSSVGNGRGYEILLKDGKLVPKAGSATMNLTDQESGQMNQMLLPEKPESVSASAAKLSAARSAETIISRKDLPLEYRDFAQSYFIRLTEGEGK